MRGFREALSRWVVSPLQGITFRDWCRLVGAPEHRIAPEFLPRVLSAGIGSILNSALARIEQRRFGERVRATRVEAPLFILGSYRSGTTHLHNLLAVDRRFGFPNYYQVTFPRTFLTTEAPGARVGAFLTMRRRPFDGVELGIGMPAEDELALCSMTLLSYHMCWHFPAAADRYRRFVTFDGVGPAERRRFKDAFLEFARKLTLRLDRPLVLKSPCHTARIPMILELFPDARFVHIHRDPFDVFRSTRAMEKAVGGLFQFQRRDLSRLDEHILWRYRATYDAYLRHRGSVPDGNLVEIAYADLVAEPMKTLRRVYDRLGLPAFDDARPAVRHYLAGLRGYRTRGHAPIEPAMVRRITGEWGRFFDAWGYETADTRTVRAAS